MNDTIRAYLTKRPELLRRYERNEARYILQLPKNYDILNIDFNLEEADMEKLVLALAELDWTIDEWVSFKLKELILSDKTAKDVKKD